MKLAGRLKKIPEWGQAFLLALGLLLLLHLFVLRWVTVRSTSMYATLLPGDLVGVERWAAWTGLHRGDIAVFHDPVQDDRPMHQRQLLVKRIAGGPGDEVEIRDGNLFVNGIAVPPAPGQTGRWMVRLKEGTDASGLLAQIGLPADYVLAGRTVFELPLNEALAARVKNLPEVEDADLQGTSRRAANNLFPFGPNFRWNNDNYGPLHVPAAGDTVEVNPYTLPIYDRIISRYEHNVLAANGKELTINGKAANRYVIRKNYYFVLGDSRDFSADSRYWGFVPGDHLVGRASFVLLNARSLGGHPVQGRILKGL